MNRVRIPLRLKNSNVPKTSGVPQQLTNVPKKGDRVWLSAAACGARSIATVHFGTIPGETTSNRLRVFEERDAE